MYKVKVSNCELNGEYTEATVRERFSDFLMFCWSPLYDHLAKCKIDEFNLLYPNRDFSDFYIPEINENCWQAALSDYCNSVKFNNLVTITDTETGERNFDLEYEYWNYAVQKLTENRFIYDSTQEPEIYD